MAALDRAELLSALAGIGDEDEDTAAAAGHAAARIVSAAGLDWSDVIASEDVLSDLLASAAPADTTTADPPHPGSADNNDDALILIDKLLARSSLFEGTREDLQAYKSDIAAGEFDSSDLAYVNALYSRVMKESSKS